MTLKKVASRKASALFALIVFAYGVYAGCFIYKTSAFVEKNSYVLESSRYFVLFDDAMISMRYARNLAEGQGLVWNPGSERVEGYTNPLWVGYMAVFHLDTFGIDVSKIGLCIQISAALFLIANLFVVKKIADLVAGNPLVALGAVVFTAFYLPLNTWSLQGTEVSILTLIMSLAAWWTLKAMRAGRFSAAPYLLLGFSTLIRMDMAAPFLGVLVFLFFADPRHRRKHLIAAPLILAFFFVPQTLFRLWYYDELLPNTYYLKMEGYPVALRIDHGLEVTFRFFAKVTVLPFGVFVFRRDRWVRFLAWMFVGQALYSIYVGGDAWEWYGGSNRYLSIAMPILFILLWCTLVEFYTRLIEGGRQLAPLKVNVTAARCGLGLLGLFLLVNYNATYGSGALNEWLLMKPSLFADENGSKVRQALLLEALTTEQATTALAGAGIVPYFAHRPFIDMLGKNDKKIGRMPMDREYIPEFLPGHMKWDYGYSIGELKPDIVLELWVREQDAGPYLDRSYHQVWFSPKNANIFMLADSPNILWERLR